MRFNTKTILFLLLISISSCYYDVEEELYSTIECATENVTYSEVILPLLQNNCYSCHDAANNFGGITLEGYEKVKFFVDNNQLIGVIRHQSGFSSMPKNQPQLVECEIEKIETWVFQGAPNN